MTGPLISVEELASSGARLVDTRWKLGASEAGRVMFEEGHIPGAVHLDMDRDLAAPPGSGGRHPLPAAADFAETMSRAGIDDGTMVVAYDDGDGMGAARLWWLMRHFGHDAVAVLDGGIKAWREAGKPIERGASQAPQRRRFEAKPRDNDFIEADDLRAALPSLHLLDARAPERWRGDIEPVDRVPGHIPGAINAPAGENLRDGRFLPAAELRQQYERRGILDGRTIVASCGSGVSACVDVLALELAGIEGAKLYPGSYSGWLAKGFPTEKG